MDVWTAFCWKFSSVGSEVTPLGEPIATCEGCQVRHANNNITIPPATLFFLNAYTSGTGEDGKWHHLVRIEVMSGAVSFSIGQESMEWTRRFCDGVRCRRPVCRPIGRRFLWMTLSFVATLISSQDYYDSL